MIGNRLKFFHLILSTNSANFAAASLQFLYISSHLPFYAALMLNSSTTSCSRDVHCRPEEILLINQDASGCNP
jgi:hypothetical protein